MPPADFFNRFGLFIRRNFLDAEFCALLRAEMCSTEGKPATIRSGTDSVINENVRRVRRVGVSTPSKSLLKTYLSDLQTELENQFKVTLNGFERPQFLTYSEGSFYTPHQDSYKGAEALQHFRERKVSIVIFLNNEAPALTDQGYSGGQLTLYGLIKDSRGEQYGFPVTGEEGLLIAFPSDLWHEVTPVTRGIRFTVVTWYS